MKFKSLLPLALLALPFIAAARPASPDLAKMINPDGSSVELYFEGNADFNYAMSADRTTLMEQNAEGYWVPIKRAGRVLTTAPQDIELLYSERPGAHLNIKRTGCGYDRRQQVMTDFPKFDNYMAQLDDEGRSTFPTVAPDIHGLVILIEYADTFFTFDNIKEEIEKMCNQKGYSEFGAVGSARDFFEANSGGKFVPTFDVYGPVRLSNTSEYYTGKNTNLPGAGTNARFGYAIKEALELLDDEIDYSKYDYDQDGKIDNIFFFYAGYGQADSRKPGTIWPHQADWERYTYEFTLGLPRLFFDDVEFVCYACSNELSGLLSTDTNPWLDGVGCFCHEFCHVLGLPDHYDVNSGGTKTPRGWDLMANGSYNNNSTCPPYLNGMERWLVGWDEYEIAEDGKTYTLNAPSTGNGNCVKVGIPRAAGGYYNEYFVLESRKKEGWDEFLPGNPGLLVWHIDFSKSAWARNQINTDGLSRVEIIYCNDKGQEPAFPGSGTTARDYIYPYGDVTLKTRIASSRFNPYITGITYNDETGVATFDYNMIQEPIEEIPTGFRASIPDPNYRNLRIQWDAMEGVDTYLVTISYTSAAGYKQYISGFNNSRVRGNVIDLRNMNEKAWNSKIEVKVTPFYLVPGLNSISESFVPAEVTGIEEIGGEVLDIEVGNGYINAPAGAEIYNLQGVRTSGENLPAGVYVVRYAGKSVKVLVK